jgi:hypothetical protein
MQSVRKDREMQAIFRVPRAFVIIAALFALAQLAPVMAQEDVVVAAAPALPSWDETSGYGSVEASRAAIGVDPASIIVANVTPSDARWAPVAYSPAENEAIGYAANISRRLTTVTRELAVADPGSVHEQALIAELAAVSRAWDETSGYASVEASRALAAMPAAPVSSAATNQALALQRALADADPGSQSGEALVRLLAASNAGDDTGLRDYAEASTSASGGK